MGSPRDGVVGSLTGTYCTRCCRCRKAALMRDASVWRVLAATDTLAHTDTVVCVALAKRS